MIHLVSLFFYNVFISLYWCAIFAASFFNTKARQWIDGRKHWKCGAAEQNSGESKRYWFHCASLGEFEQARPVIEKLKTENPKNQPQIILTFFSPSGYEVRKNYEYADVVMYLPLDTKANARDFLDCFQPDVALFVKYEFWYHYLNELKQRSITTVLFSSVFRPEQVFFQWYGWFFRGMLHCFTKIFVQNGASQSLLQTISVESEICFDTRFDRVVDIALSKQRFGTIEKFKQDAKLLVAGSTWRKDEQLILKSINEDWLKGYKYIIAPHQIDTRRLAELKSAVKVRAKFFSELTEANAAETDVVIVDSIGKLASLYAYADIAYVGGGFNSSVHNILEAAVYGVPVLFGPNHQKSEEAKDLAIALITNQETFKNALLEIAGNFALRVLTGGKNKIYVLERRGGAGQIVRYLNERHNHP